MRMTRLKIERLLVKLADEYELPLSRQQRDIYSSQCDRRDIPMDQLDHYDQVLLADECYKAIKKLLSAVPKGTVL